MLAWYDAIVASVTEITAGNGATAAGEEAFGHLSDRLRVVIDGGDDSSLLAAAAGAGVAVNRAGHLQRRGAPVRRDRDHRGDDRQRRAATCWPIPARAAAARAEPAALDAAIDESLRLEPAAAVIDRYATADVVLGDAEIAGGDLVRLSITAANRDPAVFPDPDAFDPAARQPAPARGLRAGAACLRRGAPGAPGGARGAGRVAGAAAGAGAGPRSVRPRSGGWCSASRSGWMWCGRPAELGRRGGGMAGGRPRRLPWVRRARQRRTSEEGAASVFPVSPQGAEVDKPGNAILVFREMRV